MENFAGLMESKASKAVLVTLYSAFSQCRAFGDEFAGSQPADELTNMVSLVCDLADQLGDLLYRKSRPQCH